MLRDELEKARKAKRVPRCRICDLLESGPHAWHHYEHEGVMPSVKNLVALSVLLDVSLDELLQEELAQERAYREEMGDVL